MSDEQERYQGLGGYSQKSSVPLDHVERPALPWRDEHLTECGRPLSDVKSCLTRSEAIAKWKAQGPQRAGLTTCITCIETVNRHHTWEDSPSQVLSRHIKGWGREETQLDRELRAIALLIEAHKSEFVELLSGLEATVSLKTLREQKWRAR